MSSVSCFLFCVLWITVFDKVELTNTEDILDKIKVGLQHASNYLETAKDIADLVSKSLGHKQKRGENGNDEKQLFGPSNFVSAFFRLIGFDSQKIAAIAVNSVVFLAQMISTLFGLKSSQSNISRNIDNEELAWDPLKFTLENKNKNVQNLIEQAKNPNLPNQLIARMTGSDSACIRLLLCKSSPIIRAVQTSLNNKSQNYMHRMIAWLPSRKDFEANSDKCEANHIDCRLFSSS
ncbi:PREDICTED: uncharacterized protein LOC108757432 [Trachymyrmex cornetzi]|uniref:Uncharacterized protein n=1 Tax=Trachymyrmex cornetzi TaxID=471704 RepID=A0A151JMX6_9HYME|nr:PREDICTED: uncharacterized protein LOC108757432 [Trachymyrmex cornetzi]KYN27512.1 hypothetical protein ALC57_03095 [Trachymyrmex cornetzi]